MDLVFEGSLSASFGVKEVLQAASELPAIRLGLLRFSNQNFQGKILTASGLHIVGASCSSGERDSAALELMLALEEASFAFLDFSGCQVSDPERSMYISLQKLFEKMPLRCKRFEEFFDQESLLDKVFGASSAPSPCLESHSLDFRAAEPEEAVREFEDGTLSFQPLAQLAAQVEEADLQPANHKRSSLSSPPITSWNLTDPLPQAPLKAGKGMLPAFVQIDKQEDFRAGSKQKSRLSAAGAQQDSLFKRFLNILGIV